MSRALLNFVSTLVVGFILSQFLPWWHVMLAAFIIGFVIDLKGVKVFLIPFLAMGLLWLVYGLMLSAQNDFILTKKIGVLFTIGESAGGILAITFLIGGLAAGVAGILGKQLKTMIK
ncbi:hypothetical protein [Aegicerativicinus sediminis]|uniref:hypothetical protein n=1 Tax=Aegicerativicinus sediminis TaxID=2893202 RepID=UPI001E2CF634|nr:hypothetical protein [Aegicerativicinus sediminis]